MNATAKRNQYAVIIFFVLITAYTYVLPKGNWNSTSRMALTRAIVEEGVFYIDTYHEYTGDKAYVDGHYYSSKSIGPSIIAVPAYFLYRQVASLPVLNSLLESKETLEIIAMTWFSTALPSALLGVVFFLFASKFTSKLRYAVLVTLAYSLGTITFPYSTVMFQHQTSVAGLFFTFYILWQIIYENTSKRWLWLVGLLTGITMISDYLAALLVSLVVLWAIYKARDLRWVLPIVIGALPAILLLLTYNSICFGSPLTLSYSKTMWSAVQGQGFFGLTFPKFDALWGITFSSFRGLFFISPYLLLGFYGLYLMWKDEFDRSVVILFCTIIALTFLYNASAVMWWGGWSIGPRYSISAIPFLAFPVLFSLKILMNIQWGRLLLYLLLVFSVANVWIQTLGTYSFAPDIAPGAPRDKTLSEAEWTLQQYHEGNVLYNPLIDYSIPRILNGEFTDTIGSMILGSENIVTTLMPLIILWTIGILIIVKFKSRWLSMVPFIKKPESSDH